MNSIIKIYAATSLFVFALTTQAAGKSESLPLLKSRTPEFPSSLANQGINNGFATIACAIDDEGFVVEYRTLLYSHPAFAQSAESVLSQWQYLPTDGFEENTPWPRIDLIRFEFERSGQITTRNHGEAIRDLFPEPILLTTSLSEFPLLSTDGIARLEGNLPTPPVGVGAGDVVVEFLVDEFGAAHLPIALSAKYKEQAVAAVEAVRSWTLALPEPELARPAARVRWTFRFPDRSSDS